MRLADFILRDMGTIVAQWEAFAATLLPAAANMQIARSASPCAADSGSRREGSVHSSDEGRASRKINGRAPVLIGAPETAAQTHALLRARGGFSINQLAAEYRALRASVLCLWMDDCQPDAPHMDDVIRFNEAIDQALAESVDFFIVQVDQGRNLLLGMLGHDMGSPLQTVQITATYLAALNAGESVSVAASRLIRSGARMQALLDDMVEFNRTVSVASRPS